MFSKRNQFNKSNNNLDSSKTSILSPTNLYMPRLPACWLQGKDFPQAKEKFSITFKKFGKLRRYLYRPAGKEVAFVEYCQAKEATKAINSLEKMGCDCGKRHQIAVERQLPKKYSICPNHLINECSLSADKCSYSHTFSKTVYLRLAQEKSSRHASQYIRQLVSFVECERHNPQKRAEIAIDFANLLIKNFLLEQHKVIEQLLEKSIGLQPSYRTLVAELFCYYSIILLRLGRTYSSESWCRKAERLFGAENHLTCYCKGVNAFMKKEYQNAKKYLLKAKTPTVQDKSVQQYLQEIREIEIKMERLAPIIPPDFPSLSDPDDKFIRMVFTEKEKREMPFLLSLTSPSNSLSPSTSSPISPLLDLDLNPPQFPNLTPNSVWNRMDNLHPNSAYLLPIQRNNNKNNKELAIRGSNSFNPLSSTFVPSSHSYSTYSSSFPTQLDDKLSYPNHEVSHSFPISNNYGPKTINSTGMKITINNTGPFQNRNPRMEQTPEPHNEIHDDHTSIGSSSNPSTPMSYETKSSSKESSQTKSFGNSNNSFSMTNSEKQIKNALN